MSANVPKTASIGEEESAPPEETVRPGDRPTRLGQADQLCKGAAAGEETERSLGARAGGCGWPLGQARRWEQEQEARRAEAGAMEERGRTKRPAREFQKDPEAVSKKTERAIKKMGAKPNHNLVEELAVQVVAYRQEGRGG